MSLTVRDKYLWQQMADEKVGGMANLIPGLAHFVVPGASATHFAFMKDRHRRVYTTMKAALDDCVAGRGDAIVLLPGAHTVSTASLAMSKAGVSIWGPEAWLGERTNRPSASITTDITADEIMNITGAECGLFGLKIIPITAGVGIDFSAAAHGLRVRDCFIDMATPVVNIATKGISALGAAQDVRISGLTAESDGAQGEALTLSACLRFVAEDLLLLCTAGTWAKAVITGAGTTGTFKGVVAMGIGAGAITAAISGNALADQTSGILITDMRANDRVTTPVDDFSAGFAVLAENYKGSPGGGSGGALITAIT